MQLFLIFLIFLPSISNGSRPTPPPTTTTTSPSPPPFWKKAQMARYIMHNTDWVAMATISIQNGIKGYPFATVKSMSDGPTNNSTGIPYFYMSNMELSQQDINEDSRCTILASLSEIGWCKLKDYDPQDPRCAKAIITGKMIKVKNGTVEYDFAKNALMEKHPEMQTWPADHGFFVSKLEIEQIEVLDFFGGISKVEKEDYFNANSLKSQLDIIDVKIV